MGEFTAFCTMVLLRNMGAPPTSGSFLSDAVAARQLSARHTAVVGASSFLMILFMAFLFVKSWDCCSRAAAIENVHLLYVGTAQADCMKNIVVRDTCRSDFVDKENEESSTGASDLMLQAKISAEEQSNWP